MLEYDWGASPSHILLSSSAADDSTPASHDYHRHQILDPYSAPAASDTFAPPHPSFPLYGGFEQHNHQHHHFQSAMVDPRVFAGASYPPAPPMMSLDLDAATSGFMIVPKPEPGTLLECTSSSGGATNPGRIGLNLGLGGRTYFSTADEDFISRLYRRSRGGDGGLGGSVGVNSPRCQAEGCNADLSNAKHYHRRHKVCEFHSKASTVVAGGLTQRFCQQCSRFHVLTEFDNGKRSCRRRLADHNRRRRKCQQPAAFQDRRPSQLDKTHNSPSSENPQRSPSDSGVGVSPPRMSLDSFRSMQEVGANYYNSSAASSSVSTSSSSMFY